jgi:uncharacterized protein YukE
VAALSEQVGRLGGVVAGKADGTALAATGADLAGLREALGALQAQLTADVGGVRGEVGRVREAVSASQLRASQEVGQLAARLDGDVAALQGEVSLRALVTAVEATDEAVMRADAALSALSRKVDVCLRFVSWYGAHGEAYEHNAAQVERHLAALTRPAAMAASTGGGASGGWRMGGLDAAMGAGVGR